MKFLVLKFSIHAGTHAFGRPELKGYLADVDFEARDGLSIDQFIVASVTFSFSFLLFHC
jgi:hypothetical protein